MKPTIKTNLPEGPFLYKVSPLESCSPTENADLTNLRSTATTQPSGQHTKAAPVPHGSDVRLEHNDRHRISHQHGEQNSTDVKDKSRSRKEKKHQSKAQSYGREIEDLRELFSNLSTRVPSTPGPTPVPSSLPAKRKPKALPSIPEPRPLLDLLPAELKAVVLRSLDSFNDLYALTQASVAYYIVAQRNNIFTTTVLKDLDWRNISILPQDVSLPSAVTEIMFKIRVRGLPSAACDSDTLNWAFDKYYRQTRKGCTEIRLRSDECLALMSVVYVTEWEFKLQAHPGDLAHDVPQPRERIEHVIWMEIHRDEEGSTQKDFTATKYDALALFKKHVDYPWGLEIHRVEKDLADKKTSHCHRLTLMEEPGDDWLAKSHQLCSFSSHNLVPYKRDSFTRRQRDGEGWGKYGRTSKPTKRSREVYESSQSEALTRRSGTQITQPFTVEPDVSRQVIAAFSRVGRTLSG